AYPVANPIAIDPAAEAWVATLKDMVNACRSLRGEMNLSPAQKVPLIASDEKVGTPRVLPAGRAGNTAALQAYAPYLAALA
ncbi:MAG: hypothetical protein I8H95_06955, partial [Rhodocyclales bacterium]|nr:hypothetical protein [Rhodocyclales bacterium]